MKVGIIGAGQIGGTLTRRLRELDTRYGCRIRVHRKPLPTSLTKPVPWPCGPRTPRDADLVIVSIPQKNVPDLADGSSMRVSGGPR